jgi:hypothetical protein
MDSLLFSVDRQDAQGVFGQDLSLEAIFSGIFGLDSLKWTSFVVLLYLA